MKKILLLMLLSACLALMANPIGETIVSEFWFDAQGDMNVELSRNYGGPLEDIRLRFSNGTTAEELPEPIVIPQEGQATCINLGQLLPNLEFDPWSGEMIVEMAGLEEPFYQVVYANWEPGWRPILGQSFVAVYDMGEWDEAYLWTKETPPTPGTYPYHTLARAPLNVYCVDQNGNPVQNARVYVVSHYGNSGYTDEEGYFGDSCLCHSIRIMVLHPQTNATVYNLNHYFHPDEPVNITVTMTLTSNEDHSLPSVPLKGLEAFPNPFIAKFHDKISLRFDGDQKVLSGGKVIVYNLRGQEVASIEMQPDLEQSWIPEPDLPSGTYLLQLKKADIEYGSQRIRIIK